MFIILGLTLINNRRPFTSRIGNVVLILKWLMVAQCRGLQLAAFSMFRSILSLPTSFLWVAKSSQTKLLQKRLLPSFLFKHLPSLTHLFKARASPDAFKSSPLCFSHMRTHLKCVLQNFVHSPVFIKMVNPLRDL